MGRPARTCGEPGCPNLVRGRARCTDHERQRDRARGSASQRGYGALHREWREQVLLRDRSCRACPAPPSPSDVADHIIPIRQGGARFDLNNGQRLCELCHNKKRQRESMEGQNGAR